MLLSPLWTRLGWVEIAEGPRRLASKVQKQLENGYGVLLLDISNAFGRVERQVVVDALQRVSPESAAVVAHILQPATLLYPDDKGKLHRRTVGRGVAQGDPTSPVGFALALSLLLGAGPLSGLRRLRPSEDDATVLDAETAMGGYADDLVIVFRDPTEAARVLKEVKGALDKAGMPLNLGEDQVHRFTSRVCAGCGDDARCDAAWGPGRRSRRRTRRAD